VDTLGVYEMPTSDRVRFLHPALFECLINFVGGANKLEGIQVRPSLEKLGELIKKPLSEMKLSEKFGIGDEIAGVSIHCSIKDVEKLIRSLYAAKCSMIPLSKALIEPGFEIQ
jgi:hypothetical protein